MIFNKLLKNFKKRTKLEQKSEKVKLKDLMDELNGHTDHITCIVSFSPIYVDDYINRNMRKAKQYILANDLGINFTIYVENYREYKFRINIANTQLDNGRYLINALNFTGDCQLMPKMEEVNQILLDVDIFKKYNNDLTLMQIVSNCVAKQELKNTI